MTTSDNNLPLFPESNTPPEGDPFYFESTARKAGYGLIAGVDEAGRGPLAGPVVAAAVILPEGVELPGVRDSKVMTEVNREDAFSLINEKAVAVGIGVVSHLVIDEINILRATLEAMKMAVLTLDPAPDFVIVDGIQMIPMTMPQRCLKRGDQLCPSVSAASVMAKVYRDRIMRSYHDVFPGYAFSQNKGYGTAYHRAALKKCGPSPIHRLTYKGVL